MALRVGEMEDDVQNASPFGIYVDAFGQIQWNGLQLLPVQGLSQHQWAPNLYTPASIDYDPASYFPLQPGFDVNAALSHFYATSSFVNNGFAYAGFMDTSQSVSMTASEWTGQQFQSWMNDQPAGHEVVPNQGHQEGQEGQGTPKTSDCTTNDISTLHQAPEDAQTISSEAGGIVNPPSLSAALSTATSATANSIIATLATTVRPSKTNNKSECRKRGRGRPPKGTQTPTKPPKATKAAKSFKTRKTRKRPGQLVVDLPTSTSSTTTSAPYPSPASTLFPSPVTTSIELASQSSTPQLSPSTTAKMAPPAPPATPVHGTKWERNRAAATKCRAKQKAATNNMVLEERLISEKREQLIACLHDLKKELFELKTELLKHGECNYEPINQYLAGKAKRIGDDAIEEEA